MKFNFDIYEMGERIKNAGAEATVNDPSLLLPFLKLYSFVYLHGGQPSGCGKIQRGYWNQFFVMNNYKQLLDMVNKAVNRTCVPAWKNIKFFVKLGKHVSANLITDEQAIEYIEKGIMSKDDFLTLPKMPEKETIVEEQTNEQDTPEDKPVEAPKKTRKRKK